MLFGFLERQKDNLLGKEKSNRYLYSIHTSGKMIITWCVPGSFQKVGMSLKISHNAR